MTDKNISILLGQRLKMRRTMLGLSQEALGNEVGVAPQQVQKYEKGVNVMSAVRLHEFAKLLKVPEAYFYEDLYSKKSDKYSSLTRETEELAGEYKIASDRESIEVLKSFKRIKDHAVRKRIADLMRTLSTKEI